jgi:hypothetical protein
MQRHESVTSGDAHLRFVFRDRVLSFCVRPNATFAEIADKLSELSILPHGHPIAIDVTLAAREYRSLSQ